MKKTMMAAIGLVAALTLLVPTALAQGTLKSIEMSLDGARLTVLVSIEGVFSHETSFLASPKRLVLDLTPVSSIAAAPYTQVGQAGVLDIRTGQFKPETARVVFDIGASTPAYSISAAPTGVKITFWVEEGTVEDRPAQPVPGTPARPERRAAERPASTYSGRDGFFFKAGAGWSFFLNPSQVEATEYVLYGETATSDETFTWKSGLAAEAAVGKFFHLGGMPVRAGLEFSFWQFKPELNVALSLPHPFLMGTNRPVSFLADEGLATSFLRFTLFAQLSFFETEKLSVWFGPVGGITKGKLITLDDYTINEKAPYGTADVSISDLVYYEHVFSNLHIGAGLGLEYRLMDKLSLSLDTKFLLFSPQTIKYLDKFNLVHIQPTLALQYSF